MTEPPPIRALIAFVREKREKAEKAQRWRVEDADGWRSGTDADHESARQMAERHSGRQIPKHKPGEREEIAQRSDRIAAKEAEEVRMFSALLTVLERQHAPTDIAVSGSRGEGDGLRALVPPPDTAITVRCNCGGVMFGDGGSHATTCQAYEPSSSLTVLERAEAGQTGGKIHAPFTAAQVEALNRWQDRDDVHPFTCARHHGGHGVILRASERGWGCPSGNCGYEQYWAHAFMAVPSVGIAPDTVGMAQAFMDELGDPTSVAPIDASGRKLSGWSEKPMANRIAKLLDRAEAVPQIDPRVAWEAGFILAVSYNDNWIHFAGEQKERQWNAFVAKHREAVHSAGIAQAEATPDTP